MMHEEESAVKEEENAMKIEKWPAALAIILIILIFAFGGICW
jgi:hypothetical protein